MDETWQCVGRVYAYMTPDDPWAAECLLCPWYERHADPYDGQRELGLHVIRHHVPTYVDAEGEERCVGGTKLQSRLTVRPFTSEFWMAQTSAGGE